MHHDQKECGSIAHFSSERQEVDYQRWDVVQVANLNLPIVYPPTSMVNQERHSLFLSQPHSLLQYHGHLLPNEFPMEEAQIQSNTGNSTNFTGSSVSRNVPASVTYRTKNMPHDDQFLSRTLIMLLEKLEDLYLGTIQSTQDATVSLRLARFYARLVLLRPCETSGFFQICFL